MTNAQRIETLEREIRYLETGLKDPTMRQCPREQMRYRKAIVKAERSLRRLLIDAVWKKTHPIFRSVLSDGTKAITTRTPGSECECTVLDSLSTGKLRGLYSYTSL